MKKIKKILILIIFILIIFIAGMLFANQSNEPNITSTLIKNRLEQSSELITTKYYYTNVGKYENSLELNGWDIPLTNKNFILSFDGEINLGINTEQLNIDVHNQTIKVTCPTPEVINHTIDEDSIEVFDETKNIFNPISVEDYKEFATQQKKKALQEAKDKGLMKEAKSNTKKTITNIIQLIDENYTVEVTFKER